MCVHKVEEFWGFGRNFTIDQCKMMNSVRFILDTVEFLMGDGGFPKRSIMKRLERLFFT